MYINKPSLTNIEAAGRINLLHSTSCRLNSKNLENLVKYLYPSPDMRHFMIVTKTLLLSDTEIKHYIILLNQDRF